MNWYCVYKITRWWFDFQTVLHWQQFAHVEHGFRNWRHRGVPGLLEEEESGETGSWKSNQDPDGRGSRPISGVGVGVGRDSDVNVASDVDVAAPVADSRQPRAEPALNFGQNLTNERNLWRKQNGAFFKTQRRSTEGGHLSCCLWLIFTLWLRYVYVYSIDEMYYLLMKSKCFEQLLNYI